MLMKIEYPNNDYKEIDILKSSISMTRDFELGFNIINTYDKLERHALQMEWAHGALKERTGIIEYGRKACCVPTN